MRTLDLERKKKKRKHEGKQEKKKKWCPHKIHVSLLQKTLQKKTSTGLYQTMTKRRINSVYVPSSFPSSSSSSSSSSHHSFAPLMHTIFFFYFFFFFFLSPPPHIFATAETKKEACPFTWRECREQQRLREVMTMKQLSRSFHRAEIAYRRAALVRPVLLPLTL